MKRVSAAGFAALVVLPWAIGTFGTVETPRGFGTGLVIGAALVEVCVGLAALAVAAAVTGRIRVRYAWLGIAVAVAALILGRLHQGVPVWPAGACWLFVITTGIVASRAVTVADGALVAACATVAVAPGIPHTRYDGAYWLVVALSAGATAVSIAFGNRHRVAEQRVAAARTEVKMAERTAMARELHDVIAHEVTGIVVLAQAGIAAGEDRSGVLARIERSGARALTDIRAMVDTLRDVDAPAPRAPSTAAASGLAATLATLGDGNVQVDVAEDADADDVPDLLRLVAHRVAAEGITNARRHAPGSAVRVTVGRDDGALTVAVSDDGPVDGAPPGPGPGGGTGLVGLAERAATVGGTVTAGPQGDGWRLTARLPWGED